MIPRVLPNKVQRHCILSSRAPHLPPRPLSFLKGTETLDSHVASWHSIVNSCTYNFAPHVQKVTPMFIMIIIISYHIQMVLR